MLRLAALPIVLLAAPASADGFLGVLFAGSVDVSAEVAGVVEELHVALGDEIDRGALLVTLESEDLRSSWKRAGAALRTAEARVTEVDAELAEIERLLERRRGAPEIFTRQQLEELETKRDVALAEREAARSTVAEKVAFHEELARKVEALDVRAPFAGSIAGIHCDVGARVSAGESLVRVLSDEVWVRFAVPSGEAGSLGLDRRVTVTPERNGRAWEAVIRRVAPEVDPATDMVFVEAALESETDGVRSGEVVRVRYSS